MEVEELNQETEVGIRGHLERYTKSLKIYVDLLDVISECPPKQKQKKESLPSKRRRKKNCYDDEN